MKGTMGLPEIGGLAVFLAQASAFVFYALIGCALALSGMLGAGGSAVIARMSTSDAERRRLAGAALILWVLSSVAVLAVAKFLRPDLMLPMAAGCALALIRLSLALRFDLKASWPSGDAFDQLLRAGFKPLVASALFLPAALLGETLPCAVLCAALLLIANVAIERNETEKKRVAGTLTALSLLMAVPLTLLPGWAQALGGLLIAWLAAVSLTAGLGAIAHLPSAFYEAYLPIRAWFIRRRAGR
jgi:hypothetical protein